MRNNWTIAKASSDGQPADPAISAFDEKVCAAMKGGLDRQRAVAAVARKFPRLHREFIISTNSNAPRSTRICLKACAPHRVDRAIVNRDFL